MGKIIKVILSLLLGLIVLSALFSVGLLFWTVSQIRALPEIEDPKAFVMDFDKKGKKPVELKVENEGFFMPKDVFLSPYFPHRKLNVIWITGEGGCKKVFSGDKVLVFGENRYMIIDRLWKVFWVEIGSCGSKSTFFGPYRLQHRESKF